MKSNKNALLLLTPIIVTSGLFILGIVSSIIQGLGIIPALGLTKPSLTYFHSVITDPHLAESIKISVTTAAVASILATILAVFISYAMVTLKITRGIFYGILKLPLFIPWMVNGLLMIYLFSGSGLLARICYHLGWDRLLQALSQILFQPSHLGVILAFIWGATPFACFFIITVMDNLSRTFAETAENLGAGLWKTFWYIILPLCLPTIKNSFIILFLSCFGCYELPLLLGMTVPRTLPVEIYYQYHHYDLRHRPYVMALNTVTLIISLLLAALIGIVFPNPVRNKGDQADERN